MPKEPPKNKVPKEKSIGPKKSNSKPTKTLKKPVEPLFTEVKISQQELAFLLGNKTNGSSSAATGNSMIDFFLNNIPTKIKKIDVFTDPVSERWGAKKLGDFCRQDFGESDFKERAFMFFNKKRNLARLYWNQGDGDQLLERGLFDGTFLLPAPTSENPWVQIPRKSLAKVLKTESPKKSLYTKQ